MTEEQYVPLAEVKKYLAEEEKARELTYEKKLALEHAVSFSNLSATKANSLVKELTKIEKITPSHAVKIAEILPQNADEVRMLFIKDRFTLEKDDIDKILQAVKDSQ